MNKASLLAVATVVALMSTPAMAKRVVVKEGLPFAPYSHTRTKADFIRMLRDHDRSLYVRPEVFPRIYADMGYEEGSSMEGLLAYLESDDVIEIACTDPRVRMSEARVYYVPKGKRDEFSTWQRRCYKGEKVLYDTRRQQTIASLYCFNPIWTPALPPVAYIPPPQLPPLPVPVLRSESVMTTVQPAGTSMGFWTGGGGSGAAAGAGAGAAVASAAASGGSAASAGAAAAGAGAAGASGGGGWGGGLGGFGYHFETGPITQYRTRYWTETPNGYR